MQNFINNIWFKIALLVLVFYSIIITDRYLSNKNEIEAEIWHKKCLAEWSDKLINPAVCGDIKSYTLINKDLF